MKIKITCILFFLITLCSCTDNKSNTHASNVQPIVPNNWPYFWRVEKDNKVSYILGVIHIGVSIDELPCSNQIKQHAKSADLVFSEVSKTWINLLKKNKTEETDDELKYLYTQNGSELVYSEDDRYFKQLSPESQKFFQDRGITNNLTHAAYSRLTDIFCFIDTFGPSVTTISIEEEIINIAKSNGIPIKPLDTPELRSQFYALSTADEVEQEVQNFQCSWVESFVYNFKYGHVPIPDNLPSEFIQFVLKNRNQEWLAKFLSAHNTHNSTFIVAGLYHFIADENLLNMLRTEGFTVSQECY